MEKDDHDSKPLRYYRALRLDILSPGMRRFVVGLIGGTVVLLGVVMIVLPGPAILVIPLGLAILGTEFAWARRLVKKARSLIPGGGKRS
jgi:tellurite resistance protein TerC